MKMIATTRRPRSRRTGRANAAPRSRPHHTLPAELVKAYPILVAQHEDLLLELDVFHEQGDYSSEHHAALCEAIVLRQRALASIRSRRQGRSRGPKRGPGNQSSPAVALPLQKEVRR